MRILISNDDGVYAPGIRKLAERLSRESKNQIYVVAPDRERSATGHALTLHKPLRVEEVELEGNLAGAWATTGTPSDCVKFAVIALLDKPPDLIVSGINLGANLGGDVLYSGTVSAAMEGAFLKIPSIACSLATRSEKHHWETAADFICELVNHYPKSGMPKGSLININVPSLPESKLAGVRITKLGWRLYNDHFEKRVDPRGKTYYWLAGHAIEESDEEDTDTWAVNANHISVTPIAFDMTDRKALETLKKWGMPEMIAHIKSQASKSKK